MFVEILINNPALVKKKKKILAQLKQNLGQLQDSGFSKLITRLNKKKKI